MTADRHADPVRPMMSHAPTLRAEIEEIENRLRAENQWAINMIRAYEAALEQLRPIYPVVVCRIEDIVVALIEGSQRPEGGA